jgi:DNA-binding transcriptional MerR regulator
MDTYKFVKEVGAYRAWIDFIAIELNCITSELDHLQVLNDPSCFMSAEFRETSIDRCNKHISDCCRLISECLAHDGWPQSELILLRDALVKKAKYELVTEEFIEVIYEMKDSGFSIEKILTVIDCLLPSDEEDKPTLERKDIDMDKNTTVDKHLMTLMLLRDSLAYDETDRERFIDCLVLSGMDHEEACTQFEHVLVEHRSKVEALDFCIDLIKGVK